MRTSRIIGGAAAALIAAGAGVAISQGGGSSPATTNATRDAFPATTIPGLPVQGKVAASDAAVASTPLSQSAAGHIAPAQTRVVKTAEFSLSVARDRVTRVADNVSSLAGREGGYVASTNRDSGNEQSATLVVRVPVAQYDEAVAALRSYGKVTSEKLGGQDVTGTLVDLDARLRSLRAQEASLNTLLGKANTVGDTLQVAQAVADVQTQVEQLAAQQAQLADQADYATITVNVLGPHATAAHEPSPTPLLLSSVRHAGSASLNVIGGMIIVLGYAIPSGLLAALGYGVWRVIRRRRNGATAEPAVA